MPKRNNQYLRNLDVIEYNQVNQTKPNRVTVVANYRHSGSKSETNNGGSEICLRKSQWRKWEKLKKGDK